MKPYYNISDFINEEAPEEVEIFIQNSFSGVQPKSSWEISLYLSGGEYLASMNLDPHEGFVTSSIISPNVRLIIKQVFTPEAWEDFKKFYAEYYGG